MTDRYQDAPRLDLDLDLDRESPSHHPTVPAGAGHDDPRRLMMLVVEAAEALSAPQSPCVIVRLEPPERSPAGPWLAVLAAGRDLFGMAEPDGHALLGAMAAGLVAACPGVRALAPVEGVALPTVTLATESGRLVTFAPLLVSDRDALARIEADVRLQTPRPAPVPRLPVE